MKFPMSNWSTMRRDLLKSKRNFTRMRIENGDILDQKLIHTIRSISMNTEILELKNIYFPEQQNFLEFMTCFLKLKKLQFSTSGIGNPQKLFKTVGFPKLQLEKLIIIKVSDISMLFRTLTEMKLQSDRIIIDCREYSFCSDRKILIRFDAIGIFLSIQKNLTC